MGCLLPKKKSVLGWSVEPLKLKSWTHGFKCYQEENFLLRLGQNLDTRASFSSYNKGPYYYSGLKFKLAMFKAIWIQAFLKGLIKTLSGFFSPKPLLDFGLEPKDETF